jgi:peptidoglycan/xylan/chitin deacetylase (PgdA/CDA1 family)
VLGNVRPGSIVIQHDGGGDRSQTLAALPTEISVLRHRGYHFATIPELLGLKVIYK